MVKGRNDSILRVIWPLSGSSGSMKYNFKDKYNVFQLLLHLWFHLLCTSCLRIILERINHL